MSIREAALDKTTQGYIIGQFLVKSMSPNWRPDISILVTKMWNLALILRKIDLASKKEADAMYDEVCSYTKDMEQYFKLVRRSRKGLPKEGQ